MNLADFLNEYLKNSQRYFERGEYFFQNSRYQEALEQYAESIDKYAAYIASFRADIFRESEYDLRKATLIFLCSLFIQIEICYRKVGDHKNADIFINVLKEVDECFQKIYKGLNAKEIEFYEKFSQGLKTHTANMQDLQDLQDLTANIQKSKISSKYSSYELDKLDDGMS